MVERLKIVTKEANPEIPSRRPQEHILRHIKHAINTFLVDIFLFIGITIDVLCKPTRPNWIGQQLQEACRWSMKQRLSAKTIYASCE